MDICCATAAAAAAAAAAAEHCSCCNTHIKNGHVGLLLLQNTIIGKPRLRAPCSLLEEAPSIACEWSVRMRGSKVRVGGDALVTALVQVHWLQPWCRCTGYSPGAGA